MKTQSSGEESHPIGILTDIIRSDTVGIEASGHTFGPLLQIVRCVRPGNRLSCRSGRGMNPDHLGQGDGAEAKGIIISQVCLDGKRKLGKVFKGLEVLGFDPFFIKFFLVKRDLFVDPFDRFL